MTEKFTTFTAREKWISEPVLEQFPATVLVRAQMNGKDVAVICESEPVFTHNDAGEVVVKEEILHPLFICITDEVFDSLVPFRPQREEVV